MLAKRKVKTWDSLDAKSPVENLRLSSDIDHYPRRIERPFWLWHLAGGNGAVVDDQARVADFFHPFACKCKRIRSGEDDIFAFEAHAGRPIHVVERPCSGLHIVGSMRSLDVCVVLASIQS